MKKYAMKAENESAISWRIILKNQGTTEVFGYDKNTICLPWYHVVRGLHISTELRHNAAYLTR